MSAIPKTISLPEDVLAKALARQKDYDYKKFSDYIHALIIADLNSGDADHVRKHHSQIKHGEIPSKGNGGKPAPKKKPAKKTRDKKPKLTTPPRKAENEKPLNDHSRNNQLPDQSEQ